MKWSAFTFIEELVPPGSVPEGVYERTVRRRVRYELSRLKTEADGGVEADPPEGFKDFFEKQEWWDGWDNWGVTWDVGKLGSEEGVLVVVPRWLSIYEEWDDVIQGELRSNEIAARKRRRIGNGSEGDI